MDQIGLKYCGGCNPHIDRSGLVREIESRLPSGCTLTTDQPSDPWKIAILVCGCPKACADRPVIKSMARCWIHVGGATVEWEPVSKERMAEAIVRKIQEIKLEKGAFL